MAGDTARLRGKFSQAPKGNKLIIIGGVIVGLGISGGWVATDSRNTWRRRRACLHLEPTPVLAGRYALCGCLTNSDPAQTVAPCLNRSYAADEQERCGSPPLSLSR